VYLLPFDQPRHHMVFLLEDGHTYDHTFYMDVGCGLGATDAATVASWNMDGTQRIEDSSGNGRHLTFGTTTAVEPSDPGYTLGNVGSAVRFTEPADRLGVSTEVLSFAAGMSIEAWVSFSDGGTGRIVAGNLAAGQQRRLILELLPGGIFFASIEGTAFGVTSNTATFPDQWTFVMATYDRAAKKLRLDWRHESVEITLPSEVVLGDLDGFQLGPFAGNDVRVDDLRITRGPRAIKGTQCGF
jgi:hypothetical protein